MVEEADACECHGDAILVARLDDIVITHRAAGLGYILHAALVSALYVVAEWEERV